MLRAYYILGPILNTLQLLTQQTYEVRVSTSAILRVRHRQAAT